MRTSQTIIATSMMMLPQPEAACAGF